MSRIIKVEDLIELVERGNWDESLYWLMIQKNIPILTMETQCILTKSTELEDNNQLNSEYEPSISIDDIEDILDHLRQQVKNPTIEQKLQALNYYIDNDAFIEVGK